MKSVAEFRKVSKQYLFGTSHVNALQEVSVRIKAGDFIVVAGPSGSGKSTFLNILGCLDKPTKGHVIIDDKDVTEVPLNYLYELRLNKIGFIFQAFNLIPVISAYENVELPLLFKYRDKKEIEHRVNHSLELVGLSDRLHHKPANLSGGQRQRVSIARAIAGSPSFIIADEPTANLDRTTSASILDLFEEINHAEKTTIVVSSHDPDVIDRARKKWYLRDGILTEEYV